jgi:hypothetical protein
VKAIGWLKGFGTFWWDFLIGDDWRIAATVVAALAAAYGLDQSGVAAWWIVPAAGLGVVLLSLSRR